jgi:uncharacterized LabA/DUF88 family protein
MALVKSILFIDGENLTLRFQAMEKEGKTRQTTVSHIPDVFVWNQSFDGFGIPGIDSDLLRVNYYSSATGDIPCIDGIKDSISKHSYSTRVMHDYYGSCQLLPRIFKKDNQSRKSRLVDISLTIDIMRHCYSSSVEVIYLFSGDGDFLELTSEIARSGKKIVLGAFSSGLESRLKSNVDRFIDLDSLFFQPAESPEASAPAPNPPLNSDPAARG